MVAIHPSDDSLKAVGININGERIEINCYNNGTLYCDIKDLVSLEIPKGVKYLYCCNNLLTELVIPEGVVEMNCYNNELKELVLPNSIEKLCCDRNVLGLDNIDWECDITLY